MMTMIMMILLMMLDVSVGGLWERKIHVIVSLKRQHYYYQKKKSQDIFG